jgi:hypothetical protein
VPSVSISGLIWCPCQGSCIHRILVHVCEGKTNAMPLATSHAPYAGFAPVSIDPSLGMHGGCKLCRGGALHYWRRRYLHYHVAMAALRSSHQKPTWTQWLPYSHFGEQRTLLDLRDAAYSSTVRTVHTPILVIVELCRVNAGIRDELKSGWILLDALDYWQCENC